MLVEDGLNPVGLNVKPTSQINGFALGVGPEINVTGPVGDVGDAGIQVGIPVKPEVVKSQVTYKVTEGPPCVAVNIRGRVGVIVTTQGLAGGGA
jgi:hypothetical protein